MEAHRERERERGDGQAEKRKREIARRIAITSERVDHAFKLSKLQFTSLQVINNTARS